MMKLEIACLNCSRCSHRWIPRKPEVRVCPKCHSPYWDRDRAGGHAPGGVSGAASASGSHRKAELPAVLRKIVERIARFKPEKIILFGSHARGTAGPDSDLDLLVVMPVKGSCRRKATEMEVALFGIPVPVDLILITPDQWKKQTLQIGGVLPEVLREGQVLYEQAA